MNLDKKMIDAICVILALVIISVFFEYGPRIGLNRENFFTTILESWKASPLEKWQKNYKAELNKLSKVKFNSIKMKGARPVQHSHQKASRGYDKLMEIMRATKMKLDGRVLSLCCGAGGWEQVVCSHPDVTEVISVTFGAGPGHEGHKNFTDKLFPGRQKIKLTYGDARTYPKTDHDVLLFDGGESRSDDEKEVRLFKQLFYQSVMRQIGPNTKQFVIKVLVPTDPELIDCMKLIQKITGKGCLMRSSHSRTTTLECYFVSAPIVSVESSVKACLRDAMERGLNDVHLEPRKYGPDYDFYRDEVETEVLQPLDMSASETECGAKLAAEARPYNHWEAKGVYAFGNKGSAGMKYNSYAMNLLRILIPTLPGFDKWRLTDTTPIGFQSIFRNKVDRAPVENHEYVPHLTSIYATMADYFLKRGFKYRELSDEEIVLESNKQGAPGFQDGAYKNVGHFLERPDWRRVVRQHEKALMESKPIGGVFNTMAKREKKKMKAGVTGSRMVAYLPIPMRLLELKAFGCLLNLTKPHWNRFGVGGYGLHDLGMRLNEIWRKQRNPAATSSDIAGFDTRVGIVIQTMENMFIQRLGAKGLAQQFYRLYAYPWIMIPIPGEHIRSELLAGRGQRMSGSQVTYAMNTITRIALVILQASVAKDRLSDIENFTREMMEGKHFGGTVSGDDEATIGNVEDVRKLTECGWILHDIGFPRKDMTRGDIGTLCRTMEEVDFCSHHYVRVTYYDEYSERTTERWAPTRGVTEIMAKATIRLGTGDEVSDEAWLSAQGNQLLVNYHHMRTPRAAGLAFKAIVNPYLLLCDKGGFLKPTPWMRQGQIMDVINSVLFGDGTHYPVQGFRVRRFQHIGYASPKDELIFDPDFHQSQRRKWRNTLHHETERVVNTLGLKGDPTILEEWRKKDRF